MSGCSFDVTCLSIHAECGRGFCQIWRQNVSFGMLVVPNLAPWGPSSDAGGLGSTQKETVGFQAWISIDLVGISGPPFGSFWPSFEQKLGFLACLLAGQIF